jgi:hypothetical protein
MNLIALPQKKLSKVTAILAGDAGDQRFFSHFSFSRFYGLFRLSGPGETAKPKTSHGINLSGFSGLSG